MKTPLSPAASAALERLIASNPFRWKKQLSKFWAQGIARSDFETELYRLRNTHGPGWLKRFKTPDLRVLRAKGPLGREER